MGISVANHKIHHLLVFGFSSAVFTLLLTFCMPAQAQSVLDECDVGEFDPGDALLTKSEKIALMEKHFQESLAAFAECMAKDSSAAGGAAAGTGSGGGAGASAAASGIEGTETDQSQSEQQQSFASVSSEPEQPPENQEFTQTPVDQSQFESATTGQRTSATVDNGQMPEDIQQYDNDTALEAQIKRAAMNEEDPILKEKLWDQYRKYKKAN